MGVKPISALALTAPRRPGRRPRARPRRTPAQRHHRRQRTRQVVPARGRLVGPHPHLPALQPRRRRRERVARRV